MLVIRIRLVHSKAQTYIITNIRRGGGCWLYFEPRKGHYQQFVSRGESISLIVIITPRACARGNVISSVIVVVVVVVSTKIAKSQKIGV